MIQPDQLTKLIGKLTCAEVDYAAYSRIADLAGLDRLECSVRNAASNLFQYIIGRAASPDEMEEMTGLRQINAWEVE